jgi:hypothetical protein
MDASQDEFDSSFHRALLQHNGSRTAAIAVSAVRAAPIRDDRGSKRQRTSAPSAAAAAAAAAAAPGRSASTPSWIDGDDATQSSAGDEQRWQQIVATCPHSWCDDEFPATQLSIDGKEAAPQTAPAAGTTPQCRCGAAAKKSTVTSDTPNKGRPYFHCATRACGFFSWADGGQNGGGSRSKGPLGWQRFPHLLIVSDYGFRATDLRQGGVGDCWFMSALAVVAERHDLIARLFADTAINSAGCYSLRFFLDGEWCSVLVDDRLPVTDAPRRAALAFEGKLAFSRCGDGSSGPSGQMLWACLLEKAYAKAHGSYKSTSGGEIQEALLDLTGAPCLSVNFNEGSFDSELLWRSMQEWKRLELPMGCATSGDDTGELREMGLCGSHAYSVLSVREITLRDDHQHHFGGGGGGGGGLRTERLVHVRNPHGVGEWNGDWSDRSGKWASVIRDADGGGGGGGGAGGGGGGSGVDDGTFWIGWTHFLMGFSVVECCLAYRGWHCRSLPNAFPHTKSVWRVCEHVYRFTAPADKRTSLYLMVLQPTKRGAWCRTDRKKSYRPGDLSVMVARLGKDGRQHSVDAVIGGGLRGAEKTGTLALELEPGARYLVVPYCLGSNPTAAETTAKQPFKVRFYSSQPLAVTAEPFVEQRPEPQQYALAVLHEALLNLKPPRPRGAGWMSGEEKLVGRLKRRLMRAGPGCSILIVSGSGVVAILAANQSSAVAAIEVVAYTKSNVARTAKGKLVSDTTAANAYYERLKAAEEQRKQAAAEAAARRQGGGGGDGSGGGQLIKRKESKSASSGGFKWPAKWQCFRTSTSVPPGELRLVLLLAKSGVQAQLGEIEANVIPSDAASSENRKAQTAAAAAGGAGAAATNGGVQMSLHAFMSSAKTAKSASAGAAASAGDAAAAGSRSAAGGGLSLTHAASAMRDGLFVSVPIRDSWLSTLQGTRGSGVGSASNCGGAHGLTATETPRAGFGCDVCGLSLAVGVAVFSCRRCNHDVCARCFLEGGGIARQGGGAAGGGGEDSELAAALAASTHEAELAAAMEASKRDYRHHSSSDDHGGSAAATSDRSGGSRNGGGGGGGGGGGATARGESDVSDDLAAAIAASLKENHYRGRGGGGGGGRGGGGRGRGGAAAGASRSGGQSGDVVVLLSSDEEEGEKDPTTSDGSVSTRELDAGPASGNVPVAGTWQCEVCTYAGNVGTAAQCEICSATRVL